MRYNENVGWVHVVDRRVLVVRFKDADVYSIPYGRRSEREPDDEALRREMERELSVRLKPDSMRVFGRFEAPGYDAMTGAKIRVTCYMADYEGIITLSNAIEDVNWFASSDVANVSYINRMVVRELRARDLID